MTILTLTPEQVRVCDAFRDPWFADIHDLALRVECRLAAISAEIPTAPEGRRVVLTLERDHLRKTRTGIVCLMQYRGWMVYDAIVPPRSKGKLMADELSILRRRVADANARLAEIAAQLDSGRLGEVRARELTRERGETATGLALDERRIAQFTTHDPLTDDRERRRDAILDRWESEQREILLHNIARFEAQGDHHNARLYRAELLVLRERLAAQLK